MDVKRLARRNLGRDDRYLICTNYRNYTVTWYFNLVCTNFNEITVLTIDMHFTLDALLIIGEKVSFLSWMKRWWHIYNSCQSTARYMCITLQVHQILLHVCGGHNNNFFFL